MRLFEEQKQYFRLYISNCFRSQTIYWFTL